MDKQKISSLCYLSIGNGTLTSDDIIVIKDKAAKKNVASGISGYLTFLHGMFWQYIEGDKQALDETYERISNDERHNIVSKLELPDKPERFFPQWDMKSLSVNELNTFNIVSELENLMWELRNNTDSSGETLSKVISLTLKLSENAKTLTT